MEGGEGRLGGPGRIKRKRVKSVGHSKATDAKAAPGLASRLAFTGPTVAWPELRLPQQWTGLETMFS